MTSFCVYGQMYMKVVNVNSSLNVRSQADINSEVVGQLSNGDIVEFISEMDPEEQHDSGECWYNIRKGDIEGWAKCYYLKETSEKPAEVQSDSSGSWIVRTWKYVAGLYVNIFWSTNGTWGIILKILGIIVLGLLLIPLFYGLGVILHGVVGYLAVGFICGIFWILGWMTGQTVGTIAIIGFFLGCAVGLYKLITDQDGFLEIFDGGGSGGSSTSHYEGGTFPKEHRCGNCKHYSSGWCTRFTGPPKSTQSHYCACEYFD